MTSSSFQTRDIAANKHLVCHGHPNGGIHYIYFSKASKYATGQPTEEVFDTPEAARLRLIELGYDKLGEEKALAPAADQIPDWAADGSYVKGAYVKHLGKAWLHISDKQGEPDEVFNVAAMSGDWIPVVLPEPEPESGLTAKSLQTMVQAKEDQLGPFVAQPEQAELAGPPLAYDPDSLYQAPQRVTRIGQTWECLSVEPTDEAPMLSNKLTWKVVE